MDRLVRARVLLAEAEALGLTIDDGRCCILWGESRLAPSAPTLAEYVETVAPSFSVNTAATYRSYWRVAVARFGDRPVDSLDADDCEAVLTDAVRRAQQRRPGSDGRSSRENCIAALRAPFGRADRAGLLTKNPARELNKPRRRASRRRALGDTELAEALDAVRTTSQEPDLDLLLVRFHLESGRGPRRSARPPPATPTAPQATACRAPSWAAASAGQAAGAGHRSRRSPPRTEWQPLAPSAPLSTPSPRRRGTSGCPGTQRWPRCASTAGPGRSSRPPRRTQGGRAG